MQATDHFVATLANDGSFRPSHAGDRSLRRTACIRLMHDSSCSNTCTANFSIILPRYCSDIINRAALAHLGERQTEVHFESCKIQSCDFWRYCVRSTEAAFPPSSVAQLVARSAVMTARSKQPEGFWFDPRLRSMEIFLLLFWTGHSSL